MPTKDKKRNWKGPAHFEPFLIPLGHLHADPANENEHSDDQIQRMTISLTTHGQQELIVILPDDTREGKHFRVIVGDARLRAADILGWSHMACSDYSEKPVFGDAYRITSNRLGQMSKLNDVAVLKTEAGLRTKIEGFDGSQIGYTREELNKAQERIEEKVKKEAKATSSKVESSKAPKAETPKHKPPSADRSHLIEFDNPEQREIFLAFMQKIETMNPNLTTPGERIMWYLANAGNEADPGWNGQSYTLSFVNPDERNKWATFLARLKLTYEGDDNPRSDVGRVFLFLDETVE